MGDKLNFRIAKLLLEINAIKLQPNNPFVWSSGIKSPIYCDNRILLSFPSYRNLVAKEIANLISQKYKSVDIIKEPNFNTFLSNIARYVIYYIVYLDIYLKMSYKFFR